MSLLPVALCGERISVLVVGAGRVGARKAAALLDAGVRVRVVAAEIRDASLERTSDRLVVIRRAFIDGDLDGVDLVIAATGDAATNSRITALARARQLLVDDASDPRASTFEMVAVHRSGPLTVGVAAGGVPRAAARIRDAIAARFDARYGDALAALARERSRLIAEEGSEAWRAVSETIMGESFCEDVESGRLQARMRR